MARFDKYKKKIRVYELQNILDVAVQEYGSIEAIGKLLADNSLKADAVLTAGDELVIRKQAFEIENPQLVSILAAQEVLPTNGEYVIIPLDVFAIFQNGDGILFQNGDDVQYNLDS